MLCIYCGTALQIHYEQAKWLHLLEKSKERVKKKMDEPTEGGFTDVCCPLSLKLCNCKEMPTSQQFQPGIKEKGFVFS